MSSGYVTNVTGTLFRMRNTFCWVVRMNILLAFAHGTASWSSHLNMKGYKGYKDGLQPESLADGNWLAKQNQPVSKIETKSDTNLRSLYES